MDSTRFGWLGETRRTALMSSLDDTIPGWAEDWWIAYSRSEVGIEPLVCWSSDAGASMPFISSSEAGYFSAYLRGRSPAALGRHLASVVADEDVGVARYVGESALNDLAARIHRLAGAVDSDPLHSAALSLAETRTSSGAFHVCVSMGRMKLDILLDRQLCARLVPPVLPVDAQLVKRDVALKGASLMLTASLDFGSVSVAELANLQVGEVLMSDHPLDDALDILLAGRGRVAQAHLCRVGNLRAVAFDGEASKEMEK